MLVRVHKIVFGESLKMRTENSKAVRLRREPNWTVGRRREPMPKCGLHQISGKQLADTLQRINGFLDRFRWKPVHEIGMDQNTGIPERRGHPCGLVHGD